MRFQDRVALEVFRRTLAASHSPLKNLSKSQIDAGGAGERVVAGFQRRDAVIDEARGSAPDYHIAVFEAHAADRIAAFLPPHKKVAGRPRETETMGDQASFSSRS